MLAAPASHAPPQRGPIRATRVLAAQQPAEGLDVEQDRYRIARAAVTGIIDRT
jgi:hypothetical protein